MHRIDLSFVNVLLLLSSASTEFIHGRVVVATLGVTNGGGWGTWRDPEYCPRGSYAVGYTMKIEPDQGGADDTSLNAIKLFCSKREAYNRDAGAITSGQGNWGNWFPNHTCAGRDDFLIAFKMRVESSRGRGDDTAANYLYFNCREFHGFGSVTGLTEGTGFWGDWGEWSDRCPNNSAICGLTTLVEPPQEAGPRIVNKTFTVNNGGSWGTWCEAKFCPTGAFAIGYKLKIEPKLGSDKDDTSLNAIDLHCGFLELEGYGGDISPARVDGVIGEQIIIVINMMENRGFLLPLSCKLKHTVDFDDTAANYVRFKCHDFHGSHAEYQLSSGKGFWGTFGSWSQSCPANTAICGLRTKIEAPDGDDTALNDVEFYCCSY